MPQTSLDPQAVALAKAIRQTESGGDFNIKGKSGEHGAYQFMPDTWKAYSSEAGINAPLESATPEQQNQVAYTKIKQWKDKGYNPGQIASMWNAGPGKPNAYLEGNKGVNSQGVSYDTQKYAKEVATNYQQFKPQDALSGGAPAPSSSAPKTLLQDASTQISDAGQGISNALKNPNINVLSKGLQAAGAAAGGVSGLINTGIEHTPVIGDAYKGLEQGIGGVLGAAAKTGVGQTAIAGYKSLPEELRGDIGAAVNIASLFPLGKGLTLGKQVVEDSITAATKGSIKKAAESELKGAVTTQSGVKGLAKAEARGLQPAKVLASNKEFLPDVVQHDGRFIYSSDKATQALGKSLDADESNLQTLLKTAVKKNIGVDLEQVRERTLKDVAKEYGMSGNFSSAKRAVNEYFDSFLESTGGRKVIDLNELNGLKRDVRGSVFNVAGDVKGTLSSDIKYQMGQSVMKQVEEIAKKSGVKGIEDINRTMGEKLEALKILKNVNGKGIKGGNGIVREGVRDIAGAAGEIAGNSIGVPFAGTFAGRGLAGLVGKKLPRTATHKLKSAGQPLTTLRKAAQSTTLGLSGRGTSKQLSK